MATATELRQEFTAYLDEKEYYYNVVSEEENKITMRFAARQSVSQGKIGTKVTIKFDKGDDCESVHLACYYFASCTKENAAKVVLKLNELNRTLRWTKFYIDDDYDITADMDVPVVQGSVGPTLIYAVLKTSALAERGAVELGDLVTVKDNS